jgi:hypothetical protein
MMSFLYPFMNFLQPGIMWPQLAPLMPSLSMSLLGLMVGLGAKASYPRKAAFSHPAFVWLLLFILVQPVSLLSGGLSSAISGFSFWNVYFIFVIVSVLLITDEKSYSRYIWGMLAGSMVVVIFGICAVIYHWPQAVGGRAGAYGMYENHNDYSFIIIQILPFLYLLRKVSTGSLARLLLGSSLLVCIAGILMSLSRGGMLAMLLEFALIILIGMEGRKRLLWIPILVIVGAAAIGYQWAKRAENQGSNYTASDAEKSRYELWRSASNMISNNPLLGVGSLRFHEYARIYGEISHDNRGKNTHNTYLEILTGTGIIGFVMFFMMIFKMIRALHRPPQAQGPPLLDAMRRATLISLYAILFRAILDAKPHDWSFYVLCSIGLAYVMLQSQVDAKAKAVTTVTDAVKMASA